LLGFAVEFPEPDLFTCVLIAPSAVTFSSGLTLTHSSRLQVFAFWGLVIEGHAGTRARKAVPDSIRVVCLILGEGERTQVVASHVVAIILPIESAIWPCAVAIVEGHTNSEVHLDVNQGLGCFHLHLKASDALNAELVAGSICSRNDFILNVPHDAREVAAVHVQGGIVSMSLRAIHVKRQKVSVAGVIQRFVQEGKFQWIT